MNKEYVKCICPYCKKGITLVISREPIKKTTKPSGMAKACVDV